MKHNAWATQPHYINYIHPIWQKLPNNLKDQFLVHPRCDGQHNLTTAPQYNQPQNPLIVAGWNDAKRAPKNAGYIWIEHGAGQTYGDTNHGNYANHPKPNMAAAITPGPYCTNIMSQANPDVPIIQAGAYTLRNIQRKPRQTPPTVIFAWHWKGAGVAPEADTGFSQFREAMLNLHPSIRVKGHAHPRMIGEAAGWYRDRNIETVEDSIQVLEQADLIVADNTSLIYEAAALDIPVVIVNPSMYRKTVSYGLRFWDMIPGPQADHPDELPELVSHELKYRDNWADSRREISRQVYGQDPFGQLDNAVEQLVDVMRSVTV